MSDPGKILLIGSRRARAYAMKHHLVKAFVIAHSRHTAELFPHPADQIIYFGDEAAFTVDELWKKGFSLFRGATQGPSTIEKVLTPPQG